MWRIAILKKDGQIISENFETKPEAEEFALNIATKEGLKTAYIINKETKIKEKVEGLE